MFAIIAHLWSDGVRVYGPFADEEHAEAAVGTLYLTRAVGDRYEVVHLTKLVVG